ncbi:MAG: carboxy-S-adenosyl-L-methionine synthase CmoA [Gammaproteobacteria bacterium]|nr:MAG: carboxy-S-adenosyl-L-methionine synthase CmoA [Pseudomonadota bacterium]PIE38843.1 MAG: carboxy-S-adenosyl-L-methionine synthase CmoA [Gammaproteobacteria bacterium]
MTQRDDLYAAPVDRVPDFSFDEAVARVFPDMIRRSVPGYTTIIPMIELITGQYARPGSNTYDLGCSLGASTLAMRHGLKSVYNTRVIAVDNSAAMIERCGHYIELDNCPVPVELIEQDIRHTRIINASVITLNFTLQFVPPEDRVALLETIYRGMNPGGCLIISEKIHSENRMEQEVNTSLHTAFKKANGYSDMEVSQKRAAIEKVLITESRQQHLERLRQVGFAHAQVWYQCFCFTSMIALKP